MSIEISGTAKVMIDDKVVEVIDFDVETDVHDPDRSMGPEFVHIFTGYADGNEVEWHVYEYPVGDVNHVEYKGDYELVEVPEFISVVE